MARYGIISDVHSNAHALMAVYGVLGAMDVDRILCLGDIVGYGPQPSRCLDLVLSYCDDVIRGNHDEAVLDPALAQYFNPAAATALEWTRQQLGPYHLHAISHMKTRVRLGDALLLVHDTPALHDSTYVNDVTAAIDAFAAMEEGICLHGHTHLPTIFEGPGDETATAENIVLRIPQAADPIVLRPDRRYLCNPGSVGQPRDADPRAAFAILDYRSPSEEAVFTLHRATYDIESVRNETELAGLPAVLSERLERGA